jgi:hypothetical protein
MSTDLLTLALSLTANDPAGLDLTDPVHLNRTHEVADALLETGADESLLRRLEADLIAASSDTPLLLHLAAKMAVSRRIVLDLEESAHLSVVFAVYKEHQRILPQEQVAEGEDFLVRKAAQLEWLFAGREDLTWDMIVVDDSRKGGSIALRMWTAAETVRNNHVICFTDADLSTHLGQSGLLMGEILNGGFDTAIGSRREPHSVVIKQGVRNTRGKLFIYLWKRIIGILPDVVDTQCGFKAFRAETIRTIVPNMLEKKFAFDIELLIKSRLRRDDSLTRVPIAWIDSEALSTTTEIQPYLPMLQAMVGMYRAYLPAEKKAEEFAAFIESLDESAWNRLVDNIPDAITSREFGGFSEVTADELRTAAGL